MKAIHRQISLFLAAIMVGVSLLVMQVAAPDDAARAYDEPVAGPALAANDTPTPTPKRVECEDAICG